MKKTGIIGGSGFIGSHVTKKFLEENYKVKVSTTNISKEEKYRHLKRLKNAANLEMQSVNTENIKALKEFAEGCEILVHCGTPFQLDVDNPQKDLFDPTIKGTENFLNVVRESSTVKKVVFVASVAAYNTAFPMAANNQSDDHLYTETDTPFISEADHPYAQAKYYADQAVREFIGNHADLNFEIVNVYPVFVAGNALSNRTDSTSVGMQYLIKNNIAPNPFVEMLYKQNVEFALVDVRDVAQAIYKAATLSGNHGKNYYLASESYKISDMMLLLNNKEPEHAPRVVYSNQSAIEDLDVDFLPARFTLNQVTA